MARVQILLVALCGLIAASNGVTLLNVMGLKMALKEGILGKQAVGSDPVCQMQFGLKCPKLNPGYSGVGESVCNCFDGYTIGPQMTTQSGTTFTCQNGEKITVPTFGKPNLPECPASYNNISPFTVTPFTVNDLDGGSGVRIAFSLTLFTLLTFLF